jgi:hypothetical protein
VLTLSLVTAPESFRKWFEAGQQSLDNGPDYEIPLDRLAGRGDHQNPTIMPMTRAQMELKEAKKVRSAQLCAFVHAQL